MTIFDASASATGYLYQCLYALDRALIDVFSNPAFQIGLETLDDVSFHATDRPIEAIQVKHHASPGNVTDRGPDLWKTLRVWVQMFGTPGLPRGSRLLLATTADIASGSVAECLGEDAEVRDVPGAHARLVEIASDPKPPKANEAAYAELLALNEEVRLELIAAITILRSQPNIEEMTDSIRSRLGPVVATNQRDALFTYLTGWWWKQCVMCLDPTTEPRSISGLDLSGIIDELRAGLASPDQLPRDPTLSDVSAVLEEYRDFVFMQALTRIEVTDSIKTNCLTDYLKAANQRTSWTELGLLRPGELDSYDDDLQMEWKRHFDWMVSELSEAASPPEPSSGRRLLRNLEECDFRIRDGFAHRFMARGTLHLLADDSRVGWHPQFGAVVPALDMSAN